MPNVGILIAEEPNQVLDKKHQTRLPGIVVWNLILLSYNVCIQNMGQQDLTHLCVLKESILCCFPNCAFFIILMHERTIHWEQHQKLCPKMLKVVSPQNR